jgi:hypothetical protein
MDNFISPTVKILDVPIWGFDLGRFLDIATNAVLNRQKTLFTTINTYSIVMAQKNREFLNHLKTTEVEAKYTGEATYRILIKDPIYEKSSLNKSSIDNGGKIRNLSQSR